METGDASFAAGISVSASDRSWYGLKSSFKPPSALSTGCSGVSTPVDFHHVGQAARRGERSRFWPVSVEFLQANNDLVAVLRPF